MARCPHPPCPTLVGQAVKYPSSFIKRENRVALSSAGVDFVNQLETFFLQLQPAGDGLHAEMVFLI